MKRKIITLISILMIVFLAVSLIPIYSNAAKAGSASSGGGTTKGTGSTSGGGKAGSADSSTDDDVGEQLGLGDLDNYKGEAKTPEKAKGKVEKILGYIQIIGMVLAVIILMILGLKYMLGSVEEKAEYQKTLIPYIIGAFMLFTGSLIPQIIYKLAQNL